MLISYVMLLWKSADIWVTHESYSLCSQMSGYPTTVTCFSFGVICLHCHWKSMSYVLYVCHMFILLSNLLTYESLIKSYVLENMSYMSYVLYVLSYVLYIYHMFPRKLQFFGNFLNFQIVPISYVFVICHIFVTCFSYVAHMFVICRLPSSDISMNVLPISRNGKFIRKCVYLLQFK